MLPAIPRPPAILYARLPGLLARAARQCRSLPETVPITVVSERSVRDVCPVAFHQGVRIGESVARARRLCPALLAIPLEETDARTLTHRFLEVLTSLTPTIEPDGSDAAYADFTGGPPPNIPSLSQQWHDLGTGFSPITGFGFSRLAALTCAECALPPHQLADADVRWLWPEDSLLAARLHRLGLTTFGQVAAIGESALVYQFGKTGRLLYQRSLGQDFTPVRPLWPPPRIEARGDYSLEPVDNEGYLRAALTDLAAFVSQQLHQQGRFTRRLVMKVRTERGICEGEWVLPAPLQEQRALLSALWRLFKQTSIRAPIIGIIVHAEEIVLPAATTGSLFDSRAAERKLALASTKQKLRARYGIKALRTLDEFPLPKREVRHGLWKARLRA